MISTEFGPILAQLVPIGAGFLVSVLTALLLKANAPSGIKAAANVALSLLAGALTVAVYPQTGHFWADFLHYWAVVLVAWAANAALYVQGLSQVVERATWNYGLFGTKVIEGTAVMGQFAHLDRTDQPG